MKNLLQPKYIILAILCVAAFFLLRKQFEGGSDVLVAGDQSNTLCPVHHVKLRLDTVGIYVRKEEQDSAYFAVQKKYFPMAQDSFYLLEWFKDEEHKNVTQAQVWFCPLCRDAKKKFINGETPS